MLTRLQVGILLALGLVTACGGEELSDEGVPETLEAIAAFAAAGPEGTTMMLAQATPFDWDRVYAFEGATSRATMRAAMGDEDFEIDDRFDGLMGSETQLLVFRDDGAVVRQAAFGLMIEPQTLLSVRLDRWSATPDEATLVLYGDGPAPHAVRLVSGRP